VTTPSHRPALLPHLRPAPDDEAIRPHIRTLRDLWRHAISRMQAAGVSFGHGTSAASDEAAWLLLWGLHLPLDQLEQVLDARLSDPEIDSLLQLIARRCDERLPSAYLTGEAWLRGLRFLSDARALVPRSPIAELLDSDALAPWLDPDRVHQVLDLCTGGASLAIFAALAYPEARIVGADLSAEALRLAADNVSLHRLNQRITLAQGDLFGAVKGLRFDLIVCNPPYVNRESMDALPAEYLHEPQSALAGGPDGMDLVRRIFKAAPSHLNADGVLLLEIGHEIAHFEAAFGRLECTWLSTEAAEHQIALITADALGAL
jgi:ribosomal protein L3 glutamine methyltransferase